MSHALVVTRNGQIVDVQTTGAMGRPEWEAAKMINRSLIKDALLPRTSAMTCPSSLRDTQEGHQAHVAKKATIILKNTAPVLEKLRVVWGGSPETCVENASVWPKSVARQSKKSQEQ